jgi:hypothetical protein
MRRPSRPRKSTNLSQSVHQQLNMYALAASAAGVGILALAHPSEAKIVYTPAHVRISANQTIPLDLNHDGIADFSFKDMYSTTASNRSFAWLSVVPLKQRNEFWGHQGTRFRQYASALLAGVRLGPKGQFKSGAGVMATEGSSYYCGLGWADVTNRYLGLKFIIQGKVHYGWARMNVHCSTIGPLRITALLTGYAYETVPNRPIVTGQRKGTDETGIGQSDHLVRASKPGAAATLGRLAQGANGLVVWRRKSYAILD